MDLKKKDLKCDLHFTQDELFMLLMNLFIDDVDKSLPESFRKDMKQGAKYYLASKAGVILEKEEQEFVDSYIEHVLKLPKNSKEGE